MTKNVAANNAADSPISARGDILPENIILYPRNMIAINAMVGSIFFISILL